MRLWISFTCFGANESDKMCNEDVALVLCSTGVLVTTGRGSEWAELAAPSGSTGSPAPPGWHIHTCGRKKVCGVCQHSLKSMEEIPGDQPLHWDSWAWLEKGINPAEGLVSAPLLEVEQWDHCQNPTEMTSSCLLVCTFLSKLLETDSMRVAWGPDILYWDLCSQPSTLQLNCYSRENTKIGRSTTGPTFSHRWEQAEDTMVNMLPVTSSNMTILAVVQWWSGEAYPWRVTQIWPMS